MMTSLVMSAFAIHHGESDEAYRSVYQRIYEALKPGGIFINLDHVAGEDRVGSIATSVVGLTRNCQRRVRSRVQFPVCYRH